MSASASRRSAGLALLLALAACGEPAQYRFGVNVTGLRFTPFSEKVGVYPDRSVLADPENPFRHYPLGADTKWKMLENGGSVAAFYAFATALAGEPTGENQFYAAQSLSQIALTGSVTAPEHEATALQLAIDGYQSMLDHFPDAVSYDVTGTTSFRLATPAYLAIVSLGGKVKGDWVLVATPTGQQAVRSARANPDGGP